MRRLGPILLLVLSLLLFFAACASDNGSAGDSSSDDDDDDDAAADDDTAGDDDDNDDDNDTADDDDDDDDDDTAPTDPTPGFNLGLTHFHYYGDLGGFDGEVFATDAAWVAAMIDLAIIGQSDENSRRNWQAIRDHQPRGRWLWWQVGHLFNTHETAGTCAAPAQGDVDQHFAERQARFADFLAAHPAHGDGESCFLHARHDGVIRARWHAQDCLVDLWQPGLDDSAADMTEARIHTLVWDEYAWLFDLAGDCARDFFAWEAARAAAEDGFAGLGFDNLGSPLEDGFALPEQVDAIDIIEIADPVEADPDQLNAWWFDAVAGFLAAARAGLEIEDPHGAILFNGASYCSWDGSIDRLRDMAGPGVGIWCENALTHPSWGHLATADRLTALQTLSADLAADDSFLVLETMYDGGASDPTPAEVMFYLAAFYLFAGDGDVLAIKPDWNPYAPLIEAVWFDVFAFDPGTPSGPAEAHADGVFTRDFTSSDGEAVRVVARLDDDEPPVSLDLEGNWLRLDAHGGTSPVSGEIALASGDGLLLLAVE